MTPESKNDVVCPLHDKLCNEIERLSQLLWNLSCDRQETRLEKLEAEMTEQRKLLDEVRQTMWLWKGSLTVAAFLGSITGTAIVSVIMSLLRR